MNKILPINSCIVTNCLERNAKNRGKVLFTCAIVFCFINFYECPYSLLLFIKNNRSYRYYLNC